LLAVVVSALVGLAPLAATGQYPAKPIKLLNGFPPGGPTEIIGRVIGQQISAGVGQPVIVENRVGAAGTVAAEAAAKSPADGYTVLLATTGMLASAPALYPSLGYDPLKSFEPISLLAAAPFVVLVGAAVPANNLKELIELAKSKPRGLNYGSGGIGNPLHIAGEMFNTAAGVQLFHVPYKGVGLVVPDLVGGRIQLVFDVMAPYYSQIQSGKIKVLAVAGRSRLPQLPAVPTTAESGLPGYEVSVWFCLLAPKGTPGDIVKRLNAEVQAALALGEVKETFVKLGFGPQGSTPEQLSARIREDGAKWLRAVKESGAKLE
jgi:tripartite-type tricarboxylate transporter receptor subunit TctC